MRPTQRRLSVTFSLHRDTPQQGLTTYVQLVGEPDELRRDVNALLDKVLGITRLPTEDPVLTP